MEQFLTSRQIIDAIHEGLPTQIPDVPDESIPDKMEFMRAFRGYFSSFDIIQTFPGFEPTPEIDEKMQTAVETATNIRDLINELRIATLSSLRPLCMQYTACLDVVATESGEVAEKQWKAFRHNHRLRVEMLTPPTKKEREARAKFTSEQQDEIVLNEIVNGGVQNVAFNIWSKLCVIPAVHEQQEGSVILPEEWKAVGESALHVTEDIASSQQQVNDLGITWALGHPDARPTRKNKLGGELHDYAALDPEAFLIRNKKLMLNPDMIEIVRNHLLKLIKNGRLKITAKRTGCVARFMFPVVDAYILKAAEKHLYPHAERILSLPPEEKKVRRKKTQQTGRITH